MRRPSASSHGSPLRELAAGLRAGTRLSGDRGGFAELRRSAFAIGYRMLGGVSEAEDVVREGSCACTGRARAASGSSRPRLPVDGGFATISALAVLNRLRYQALNRALVHAQAE